MPAEPMLRMRRAGRFKWEGAVLVPSPATPAFRELAASGGAATKRLARIRASRAYRGFDKVDPFAARAGAGGKERAAREYESPGRARPARGRLATCCVSRL